MSIPDLSNTINSLANDRTLLSLINFLLSISAIGAILFLTKRFIRKNQNLTKYLLPIYRSARIPLTLGIFSYVLYSLTAILFPYLSAYISQKNLYFCEYVASGLGIIALFWLTINIITLGKERLLLWSKNNNHPTMLVILPGISEGLNAAFLLLLFNLLVPIIGLTGLSQTILEKTMKVLFIAVIGWIFTKLLSILENFVISQYVTSDSSAITIRKIKTQVVILKRILLTLIIIITLAAILMVFDSVKNLGAGLLTTAGLLSAIGAFASQQSLGRMFSGLQLAFTQPLRIGDTVIIDNEFGQVEEINLSYVTIKLWDLRRLIKPTDYFTKNGLLNLTRESTQLLGTVFIYCDYTLPIEPVRLKFKTLVMDSAYWDKNVSELDVTDVTEKCMQVRILVSAANADLLWKLRCEIREKIVCYIVDQHPQCLSKARNQTIALPAERIN